MCFTSVADELAIGALPSRFDFPRGALHPIDRGLQDRDFSVGQEWHAYPDRQRHIGEMQAKDPFEIGVRYSNSATIEATMIGPSDDELRPVLKLPKRFPHWPSACAVGENAAISSGAIVWRSGSERPLRDFCPQVGRRS